MNVLTSHTPTGHLHAVTCDSPAGYGEVFQRVQERQGCTVRRYSMDEFQAHIREARQPDVPTSAVPPEMDAVPELPALHTEIIHPHLGRATVTHTLIFPDGQTVAVARSARGEGLVREWQPATAAPVITALPEPQPQPSTPVDTPSTATMPSLFDFGMYA